MAREQLAVLKMLEEGKINAEQAAELLSALNAAGRPAPQAPPAERERSRAERMQRLVREEERRARQRVKDEVRSATRNVRRAMAEARALSDLPRTIEQSLQQSLEGLGLSGVGVGKQFSFEREFSGTFSASAPTVSIQNTNGHISLLPSSDDQWRLKLRIKFRTRDEGVAEALAEQLISVNTGEDQLSLQSRRLFGQNAAVDIKLWLPVRADLTLNVSGTNGSIEATGLKGADWLLKTVNGKVLAEDLDVEKLDVSAVNGRIVASCQAQEVKGRTSNGSIDVTILQPGSTRLDLHSVNGSLDVQLPADERIGYHVDASAMAGRVRVDLPGLELADDEKRPRRRRSVVAGTDGWDRQPMVQQVVARTVSGSIRINAVKGGQEDV